MGFRAGAGTPPRFRCQKRERDLRQPSQTLFNW